MNRCLAIACVVFAVGCSSPTPSATPDAAVPDAPPPLAPLPEPQAVETEQFSSGTFCGQCHLKGTSDTPAMTTASGADVSPVNLWRGSMMALASRDPFYFAVFEHEIAENPGAKSEIEAVCTRCHAPAGVVASERGGEKLSFEEITSGTSTNAAIGRDGVTCSFCHQIRDSNLGTDSSFTGGYTVGFARKIFGPHANPRTSPMEMFIRYTPEYSEHIKSSALCATCHTVIVPGSNGQEVVEQAPYLEWLNSSYNNESDEAAGVSCQGCHMPRVDEQGQIIATAIAKFPDDLPTRGRYSQHTFVGGNSFMLRLIASYDEWVGSNIPPAVLEANAQLSEEHLGKAATLEILTAERSAGTATVRVQVNNRSGHKLPTGYPTRRVWLHFTARDTAGQVVFESGGYGADGRIAGLSSETDSRLHYNEIDSAEKVQIWQQILVDADDKLTLRALDVAAVAKDNRILPLGWSNSHAQIGRIRAVGTDSDNDFIAGSDGVTFRFPYAGNSELSISAELVYQSVPPKVIDTVAEFRTAASERFVDMARTVDNLPILLAKVEGNIAP